MSSAAQARRTPSPMETGASSSLATSTAPARTLAAWAANRGSRAAWRHSRVKAAGSSLAPSSRARTAASLPVSPRARWAPKPRASLSRTWARTAS